MVILTEHDAISDAGLAAVLFVLDVVDVAMGGAAVAAAGPGAALVAGDDGLADRVRDVVGVPDVQGEAGSGEPGAQLVEIEGADHLPWAGDAQPVLDAVQGFLARLNPAAAASACQPLLPARRQARALTGVASLTGREREVAELVARGLSNPEISRQLYLSRHTVESHLKSISAKLGVQGRAKVISSIRDHNIPELGDPPS